MERESQKISNEIADLDYYGVGEFKQDICECVSWGLDRSGLCTRIQKIREKQMRVWRPAGISVWICAGGTVRGSYECFTATSTFVCMHI